MFTVLGASGYVGSALVRHLRAIGEDCATPGRGDPCLFERPLGHVIYCIGLTADFAQRPFDTVDAHVGVLRELLARGRFDSLVYLSSTRLYDSQPHAAGALCRETDDLHLNPHNRRHIYDLSKAMGEALCLQASGGRARVARLSCVYGGDLDQENFLHATIRKALTRHRLEIDSAPDTARDYIHIDDVVRLLPEIARRGRGVYNLASGVNVANRQLVAAVSTATGCAIRLTGRNGAPAPLVSVERLRDEFDFRPAAVLGWISELPARGGKLRQRVAT